MEWLKVTEDGNVEFVSEEVKLVPEIQALLTLKYNKDKGDNSGRKRSRGLDELRYMYLSYSPKSPYRDYSEEERAEEAKKDCGFPPDWQESTELKLAIAKFSKGSVSKVGRLLATVNKFLEKFEKHLNTIDLNERNNNGGLIHDPAKILSTLSQLPKTAQTIQELEQQIKLGHVGTPKSKGDHELGWMAMSEQSPRVNEEQED